MEGYAGQQAEAALAAAGLRVKGEQRAEAKEQREVEEHERWKTDSIGLDGGQLRMTSKLTPTDISRGREEAGSWNKAFSGMDALKPALQDFVANPSLEKRDQVASMVNNTATALNKALGQGAMAENEAERVFASLGAKILSPSGIVSLMKSFSGEKPEDAARLVLAKLDAVRKLSKDQAVKQFQAYNMIYEPPKGGTSPTPHANGNDGKIEVISTTSGEPIRLSPKAAEHAIKTGKARAK